MSDETLVVTQTELLVTEAGGELLEVTTTEQIVQTVEITTLELLEVAAPAQLLVETVTAREVLDVTQANEILEVALQGPVGAAGPWMPYYIAEGEAFTVPDNQQGLSAMNITIDGMLRIDGFLLEVL